MPHILSPRLIDVAKWRSPNGIHGLTNCQIAVDRLEAHVVGELGLRTRRLVVHGICPRDGLGVC